MMSIQDRNEVIYEFTLNSLGKGHDLHKVMTEFGYFKYFFFSERNYIYLLFNTFF